MKFWIMDSGDDKDDIKDEVERALAAPGGFASNLTCYGCRKKGHKKADCPEKEKWSFKGSYNDCGQRGHKELVCWEKPQNASKRRNNWVSQMEANGAGGTSGAAVSYEVLVTNFEVEMKTNDVTAITGSKVDDVTAIMGKKVNKVTDIVGAAKC